MAKDLTEMLDDNEIQESRSKSRINELTAKLAEKEKAEAEAKASREKAEAEALAASKERDFYKSFSGESSKYPNAKNHEDAIKAKVLAGYTVADATVSVLAAAGQLTSAEIKTDKIESAGGSAGTTITNNSSKDITKMTQAEKLNALYEAEKSGDISVQ